MRTDSECSAHSFWVIRRFLFFMEFTSRHLRYHFTDVPLLGDTTTQHTTRHDTEHGTHGTRDTVRRSQRFCFDGAVGSPVSALQL